MKRIIFLLILSCNISGYAQNLRLSFNEKILLTGGLKFPSVDVYNLRTGRTKDLSQFGSDEIPKSDKPTIVMTWAENCKPCKSLITDMIDEELQDDYNVIALNVDAPVTITNKSLWEKINERKGWRQIPHFRMEYDSYLKYFDVVSVPYWFILDTEQKIVNTFLTMNVTIDELEDALQLVKSGIDFSEKVYFKGDMLSKKGASEYYLQLNKNNDFAIHKTYYTKTNKLRSDARYIKTSGSWTYDGIFRDFDSNNQLIYESKIEKGEIRYKKTWASTGQLIQDVLLVPNGVGYQKNWRVDGTIESDIPFYGNKRQGEVKYYDNNERLKMMVTVKDGLKEGVQIDYIEGVPYREHINKSGQQVSTKLLNENIASLKVSYLKRINDQLKSTSYVASEDGMVLTKESIASKELELTKWTDLKVDETLDDGIIYKGSTVGYNQVDDRKGNPYVFSGEKYYPSSTSKTKYFTVNLSSSKKDAEAFGEMISNLIFLIKLK